MKSGQNTFPASILEIGSRKDMKKKEKNLEKANEHMTDVAEGTPAKKRKINEGKKWKEKRKCQSFVTEPHPLDSTSYKQCNTPASAEAALLVCHKYPLMGTAASDLMKQVLKKVETL